VRFFVKPGFGTPAARSLLIVPIESIQHKLQMEISLGD